ncbi:MAG: hypothetical protein R3247_11025 [Rhodothermales bacterium]|nr:hypothetical protein [Rhodothermales bacterium]
MRLDPSTLHPAPPIVSRRTGRPSVDPPRPPVPLRGWWRAAGMLAGAAVLTAALPLSGAMTAELAAELVAAAHQALLAWLEALAALATAS